MKLNNPVTIQVPPITLQDGTVRTFDPITTSELNFVIMDNAKYKVCYAHIHPFPKAIVLWQGQDYDNIGDYTQSQAEDRVLESLGPDIKAGLEALFVVQ